MPIQPALQDNQDQNAWADQVTQELNDAQDDIQELREQLEAALARITALEP